MRDRVVQQRPNLPAPVLFVHPEDAPCFEHANLTLADVRGESRSEEPCEGLGGHLVVGVDMPRTVDQTQLIPACRSLPYAVQGRIQLCQ